MLALAPTLSTVPKRETISDFIKKSVQQRTGGNIADFSRILEVTYKSILDWQCGRVLPTLRSLLSISRLMEVNLVELIQRKPPATKTWAAVAITKQNPIRFKRKSDYIKVVADLEAVLVRNDVAPPSLRSVARSLHLNRRTLYNNFPDLCRRISAQFTADKKSLHNLKIKDLQEEVQQAVFRLHNEGTYPSIGRISELLTRPGDLRHPDVRTARLEAMRELETSLESPLVCVDSH